MTKKYNINKYVFDIDNIYTTTDEATLYFFGWFFVRGSISKNGLVRLQVRNSDQYIIEKLKSLLEYNGPLFYIKNQVNLSFTCANMARDLLHFRQNFDLSRFSQISAQHFLRGIFDARGLISINKGRYLNCCITAREHIIAAIRFFLLYNTNININTKHYYRYSYTDTLQLIISRTNEALLFCKYIYDCGCGCDNITFYLARKFEKYEFFVNNVYNI